MAVEAICEHCGEYEKDCCCEYNKLSESYGAALDSIREAYEENNRLAARCSELEQERDSLLSLLRSIEFVQPTYNGVATCPSCEFYSGGGSGQHEAGCELHAALEGAADGE